MNYPLRNGARIQNAIPMWDTHAPLFWPTFPHAEESRRRDVFAISPLRLLSVQIDCVMQGGELKSPCYPTRFDRRRAASSHSNSLIRNVPYPPLRCVLRCLANFLRIVGRRRFLMVTIASEQVHSRLFCWVIAKHQFYSWVIDREGRADRFFDVLEGWEKAHGVFKFDIKVPAPR